METLPREYREWLAPGIPGALAVVDGNGLPQVARVWAARVAQGADVIEIYLQRGSALTVIDALVVPRHAALNVIELPSYRSRTFKGECRLAPSPPDPAFIAASLTAVGHVLHSVGMPADAVEIMLAHAEEEPRAMVSLHLIVEGIFDQSPKPGAGARL